MSAVIAYLRNLYRAIRGDDVVTAIQQEITRMSVQSDRLNESIATLTATINNVVIPGLKTSQAATDEAAFANAADAVFSANARLLAAAADASSVPVPAPQTAEPVVDTGTADPVVTGTATPTA